MKIRIQTRKPGGRRLTVVAGTMLALGMLGAGMAPAQAADTTTTFSVTSGALSITAPTSKDLGTGAAGSALTAQLGSVTVTDNRGALAGSWTATASSTDFTTGGATANETIAKSSVQYWSGLGTTTGTATFLPGQLTELNKVTLGAARTAYSASATVGNNSSTWNPTIIVNVPAQAISGSYSGTITHSVA